MTRYHICIYDICADRSYRDSIFDVSVNSIHDGLLIIMYYLDEALLVMHINYYMDNIYFNMFLLLFQNFFWCV